LFIKCFEFNIIFFQLYQNYFEQPFLEQSSEHFKREAARLLQECTVSEYMVNVLQILREEGERSKKYFHAR